MYVAMFEIGLALGNAFTDAFLGQLGAIGTIVVGKVINIIVLLVGAVVMGKLEHQTLADYAFPWRRMFGRAFWWGAAAGVVGASLLIELHRAFRSWTGLAPSQYRGRLRPRAEK
jgi:hypothetical protein